MSTTRKNFGPIWEDYSFFEAHASELAENLAGYLRCFEQWRARPGVVRQPLERWPVRLLDFGCGSGSFAEPFIRRSGLEPDQVAISLVEPNPATRTVAIDRLETLTSWPIQAWPSLPLAGLLGCFDVIVSHHVLYYVPNVRLTLTHLWQALAPQGLLLASLGGPDNQLVRAWRELFPLLGRAMPYYTAVEVEQALAQFDEKQSHRITSRLDFPDSAENRWRILRFLFAEYADQLPPAAALGFFDSYAANGRVVLENTDELFVVIKPSCFPVPGEAA